MGYKTAEGTLRCVSGLIMAHTLYVDGSTSHNLSFSHRRTVWYQHRAATSISVLHHWGTFVQLPVKPLHLHINDSLWRLIIPAEWTGSPSSPQWTNPSLLCRWRGCLRLNHMLLVTFLHERRRVYTEIIIFFKKGSSLMLMFVSRITHKLLNRSPPELYGGCVLAYNKPHELISHFIHLKSPFKDMWPTGFVCLRSSSDKQIDTYWRGDNQAGQSHPRPVTPASENVQNRPLQLQWMHHRLITNALGTKTNINSITSPGTAHTRMADINFSVKDNYTSNKNYTQ